MPNWCSNSEIIIGSKKEIKKLYKMLTESINSSDRRITNIIRSAGFKTIDEDSINGLESNRGQIIDDFEMCADLVNPKIAYITFASETAWVDIRETWYKIVKRHAPHCKYLFQSEELGCEHFVTNDKNGRWFRDEFYFYAAVDKKEECPVLLQDVEFEPYFEKQDMLKFLQDFFNSSSTDVIALMNKFNLLAEENTFGENNYFRIYHCELVD